MLKQTKDLRQKEASRFFAIWIHGLWMSIIPAVVFSYYNFGILQILGHSDVWVQVYDMIINAFFIASGTESIHRLITRIKP